MNILGTKSISKIEFIDKLREKFSAEDNRKLKLPQIIVVGDQSSGKSSLLEAISGIKLPKGVNTVTRCPIIIQMKRSKNLKTRIKYVNGNKTVEEDITNTEEEIKKVQRIAFGDKLTKEPITIIAESPNLHTLTMIDLPGIIKTETADQEMASKEKTVEIARFYMEQENSLIICVLPANQDICTTTTIELAKECNKDKSRIIVALTKLDKLDEKEATVIPDILSNKKLPIEKGYYGVIVSDDILETFNDERSTLEEKKLKSLIFWKNYKERLGLKKFEPVLVRELSYLIDKTLPILRSNINNLIGETQDELGSFYKYQDNEESQFSYIFDCQKEIDRIMDVILSKADEEIVKFSCMKEFLEESHLLEPVTDNDTFLFYWHKTFKDLFNEFNGIYEEFFIRKNSPYQNPEVLEERISKCRTENSTLFLNPKVFKGIVDEILLKFHERSSKCLNKCYDFIERMIETVLVMHIENELHSMKVDIQNIGKEVLEKQKLDTIEHLKDIFESEKSYFSQEIFINPCGDLDNSKTDYGTNATNSKQTSNYGGNTQSVYSNDTTLNGNGQKDSKNFKNGLKLKKYLEKHVTDIIGRLGVVIPNLIRLNLFVRFQKELNKLLILKVFRPDVFPDYFHISDEKKMDYCKLKKTLGKLKESLKELNQLESKRNSIVEGF